jgi:hypothetical protein
VRYDLQSIAVRTLFTRATRFGNVTLQTIRRQRLVVALYSFVVILSVLVPVKEASLSERKTYSAFDGIPGLSRSYIRDPSLF